ncbi:MAG: hypothetical protein ACFFDN_42975 [Candidatus Hodarchaeota archaeon]
MKCHLENIFSDAFKIEYTKSDKIRYVFKRIPIIGNIGSYLQRKYREAKNMNSSTMSKLKNNVNPTKNVNKPIVTKKNTILKLKPGEVVKVRSREEIQQTLDEKNQFKGVDFMKGMWQYCGQEFKVFKRVEKIYDAHKDRYRKCRNLVILEGLFCHGSEYTPECDRTCLYYWKEAWLERIE